MGRKSHRKSREGCTQCKARHVKCGEERPSCVNCDNHGTECTYKPRPQRPETESNPTYEKRRKRQSRPCDLVFQQNQLSWRHLADLDMGGLELFNHYIQSLPASTFNVSQAAFKEYAPALAVKNPFLMHGLLSVSAQHMAICMTNAFSRQKYEIKSLAHQKACAKGLREYITQPQQSEGDVAFAAGYLLGILAHCPIDKYNESLAIILNPVDMNRGLFSIFQFFIATIQDGPFRLTEVDDMVDILDDGDTVLSNIDPLLTKSHIDVHFHILTEGCNYARNTLGERRSTYQALIQGLRACFNYDQGLSTKSKPKVGLEALGRWLCFAPAEYVQDLRSKHPIALAIFATYAAGYYYSNLWYAERWCIQAVLKAASYLPAEMLTFVSWPLQVVRRNHEFM